MQKEYYYATVVYSVFSSLQMINASVSHNISFNYVVFVAFNEQDSIGKRKK